MPNSQFSQNKLVNNIEMKDNMSENVSGVKPVVTTPVAKKDCCDKPEGCGNCMKGGMPLRKESLSFITLFMVGLTTLLAVLLINEKRSQVNNPTAMTQPETVVAMEYKMPASKVITTVVELPEPKIDGNLSLEETIQNRRSRRVYSDEPVTMAELSQILWSAQGETDEAGHRAAPSAKGAYPFSLYVVVRNVDGLDNGLYLYNPTNHTLGNLGMANAPERIVEAGVQDNSVTAPVVITLAASPAKMLEKFPDADPMPNVYMEGGHIGQNIYLQAESLEMGTVVTGGFDKMAVAKVLGLDVENEMIVYLVPFGHIGEAPEAEAAH